MQKFEVNSTVAQPPPEGTSFDNAQKAINASALPAKVEHFDFVNIATGNFNEPRIPRPLKGFTGDALHARDWVGPAEYKGKTVVVVGGQDSAEDMVLLLLKFGVSFIFGYTIPFPLLSCFVLSVLQVSVARSIRIRRVSCVYRRMSPCISYKQ